MGGVWVECVGGVYKWSVWVECVGGVCKWSVCVGGVLLLVTIVNQFPCVEEMRGHEVEGRSLLLRG